MQTAEDRKCPVLSPSFSSAPGKAGAGLSPWLRGEIPNKRKDLSKGSRRPVGASQTSVGGGGARSAGTIKELVPKGGGSLGVAFPVGCYGRDTSREKAHRLPGWTQSSWVQAKWDKEGTSKSPTGVESGAWEEGAALGALQLEAQLLKGQLITQAGQTGWEPHKHEVKCMKGREAGKGPKDVSLPLI